MTSPRGTASNSEARKRAHEAAGGLLNPAEVDRARGVELARLRGEVASLTTDLGRMRALAGAGNLRTVDVLEEVANERGRQDTRWGEQNHPNGTGGELGVKGFGYCDAADLADWLAHPDPGGVAGFMRHRCQEMFEQGSGTYEAILTEEWAEAVSEPDPVKLRAELIQVAAVAVAWVEKLDRDRGAAEREQA